MTRDELIENVASIVFHHELEEDDIRAIASAILDTIYAAMQEPNKQMMSDAKLAQSLAAGFGEDWSAQMSDAWLAMLAASPLAPEGVISAA